MPSDSRAAQARQLQQISVELAGQAASLRDQRDLLIKQLRQEDPGNWTYRKLAREVGVSPEMIAKIVQGR